MTSEACFRDVYALTHTHTYKKINATKIMIDVNKYKLSGNTT